MPDGKSIITGWNDGKIRAFLPQSGKLKFEINQDCSRVVSGGGDGLIRVWKIGPQSQALIESLKEHKVISAWMQRCVSCPTLPSLGRFLTFLLVRCPRCVGSSDEYSVEG
jgi:hypothetical protein